MSSGFTFRPTSSSSSSSSSSVTRVYTKEDNVRRYCAGGIHRPSSTCGYRRWGIPSGMDSTEDTRCSYCMDKHIVDHLNITCKTATHFQSICCDSFRDMNIRAIQFRGFTVTVSAYLPEINEERPVFLVPGERAKATELGLGIFAMPTKTNYRIHVRKNEAIYGNDVMFTLKARIGDKPVVINRGENIYYTTTADITGMTSGADDSFLFTAETAAAKASGNIPQGYNESNKFYLTLNVYHRERPKPVKKMYHFESRGGGRGGGISLPCYGLSSSSSSSTNGPSGGLGSDTFGMESATDDECSTFGGGYTGGSTGSGGLNVKRVDTQTFTDKTTLIQTVEIAGQIVCDQTDAEIASDNAKYNMKDLFAQREVAKTKKALIEEYERNLVVLQNAITEKRIELATEQVKLDQLTTKYKPELDKLQTVTAAGAIGGGGMDTETSHTSQKSGMIIID